MKILKHQIGLIIFFIAACQNDSADKNKVVELNVSTVSSEMMVLAGVFKTPCITDDVNTDQVDDGVIHFFSVNGRRITTYSQHYFSDTACSSEPQIVNRCELKVTSTAEAVLTAWVAKSGRPSTPPASLADQNIRLPARPVYTSMTAEVLQTDFKARIGMSVPYGFVVDNSGNEDLRIYPTQFNFVEGQAGVEDFHSRF
ncbi:MAG: hypothetical protein OEY36_00535 [Gammaproteobacteria bacterium]|nr:hypothetical protein [Gammaproteobacteria bacterium]